MIDVDEDSYYLGAWFLSGKERDWLCVIYRVAGAAEFTIQHRFRYYVDDKAHDSDDIKNWYDGSLPVDFSEDKIIGIIDGMVDRMVAKNFCGTRLPWKIAKRKWRYIARCDGKTFARAYLKAPFVHAKKATPADIAQMKRDREGVN